jgi:hypothetical protein
MNTKKRPHYLPGALAAAGALCLFLSAPASASLIYSNGPLADMPGAVIYFNGFNYIISDSFTVSTATDITEITIGAEGSVNGNLLESLNWAIGTSAFGSNDGSGTASASDVFVGVGFSEDEYYDSFAVSTASLNPGTYWLTLDDAVTAAGGFTFWDENNGPSLVQTNNQELLGSESFCVSNGSSPCFTDSSSGSTPEPATIMLCAPFFLLAAARCARKRFAGWP